MSSNYKSILLALAAMTAVLPTVSAWNAAFYDHDACNENSNPFSYAVYSGSGSASSSCQIVGDPGNNCEYFTDSGFSNSPCTAPFQNPTLSVSLQSGTQCSFFTDDTCGNSAGVRSGPACINVARQSIDTPRSFTCHDV